MSNFYYSGQGSLYIAQRSAAGGPLGFIPVGNVPELTVNIETTKLEHKESESGSRLTDLTIVKEKKGTFEFKLENLSLDNLAMALWGTKATVPAGSVAAPGESVYVPATAVAGMRFALKYPKPSSVIVKDATDVTTYNAGTDYVVDTKMGVLTIPAGSAILTAAAAVGDRAQPTTSALSLTGGGSTAAVSTTVPGTPTVQEVQHITVDATGGTFTVTYAGQTTSALAYNISAADLQTALVALSNIAPGDVVVTGGPGDSGGTTPYILTWALPNPNDAIALHVAYSYGAHVKVDAFTSAAAPERWLRFEGINTVDDTSVIVDIFKGQFDPMTGYGLINEELGSVTMKGAILADPLQQTGSKFFRQINI